MMTANDWIDRLELISHPEGGYFKETMRGDGKGRASFSSIYFLLTQRDISHFHRIDADEVWYYHAGQTLKIHMITPKGEYHTVKLGSAEGYSLVGCMCQPGFEYEHFELLTQEYLIRQYPQYESIIKRLAISQED